MRMAPSMALLAAGSNVAMVVAACIVRTLPSILIIRTGSQKTLKPALTLPGTPLF